VKGIGPNFQAALVGLACVAPLAPGGVFAQSFSVPVELWDRPRSGPAVMERLPVKQAVAAWLAYPATRLIIHHGAGQDSLLQAEELRSWLIALAVEAGRMMLRSDLSSSESLRLEVIRE